MFNKFVDFCVRLFFKIIHVKLSEEKIEAFEQFVKFGLVGVSNTIVSYVINVLVLKFLEPYSVAWDYVAGNVVSFVLSVLWSFYWNSRLVFTVEEGQSRNTGKALLKTYMSYGLTGIVINNILSYFWINWVGLSKYIAPIPNMVVSIPLNFIINKLWAFKTEEA